jgi:hypothetical protein
LKHDRIGVILFTREEAPPIWPPANQWMEATMRNKIVRWIIGMVVAIGMTAAAISAIDRAVDYYVDWSRASSHPAAR